ncbi:MAG: GLUG motif-containing protein, partial [Sedimentisphaerales bacterium]
YIGGLVGENFLGGIVNCFSTGTLTSEANYAGIGGLVGRNYWGSIENCYSTDKVSVEVSKADLGGLVGIGLTYSPDINFISNSYFLNIAGPNNNKGVPLTDTQMKQQASFTGWDFANVWNISKGIGYPKLLWPIQVKKCSVTAGSKVSSDKITFSGTMKATFSDFNEANAVTITIDSKDMNSPFIQTFDVNSKTFKKGKFSRTITNKPSKTSFTFDTKKLTFSFSASNVGLTGLSCPVIFDINISDYAGSAVVDESIVNGKKPIPIKLLMGVKNSLRVDKSKFTKKLGVITQLSVSGGFSVGDLDDANMAKNPFEVVVGSQTFTVPTGSFKANKKGDKFTCSKVQVDAPQNGITTATFDFNKCTFTLTIKNTNFAADAGNEDFEITFADFTGTDEITLP